MQCRYYGSKVILFVVPYVYVVTVEAAKQNNVRSKTVKNRLNFVGEKCQGTLVARVPVLFLSRVLVYLLYTGI